MSPRNSSSDGDNRTPPPVDRSSGSGQGNPLPFTNTGEDSAERQRDHTSGDNAGDDDSDCEEAAAPVEAKDSDIKIETPPETVQTSLHGNGDIDEPTPQLEQEAADTEMSTGSPDCRHRYVNRSSGGGCLNAYARINKRAMMTNLLNKHLRCDN